MVQFSKCCFLFWKIISACTNFRLLGKKYSISWTLRWLPFDCYTYNHTFESRRIIDNRVFIMLNITIHQMSYILYVSTETILFAINRYTNYMQFRDEQNMWASLVCSGECKSVKLHVYRCIFFRLSFLPTGLTCGTDN